MVSLVSHILLGGKRLETLAYLGILYGKAIVARYQTFAHQAYVLASRNIHYLQFTEYSHAIAQPNEDPPLWKADTCLLFGWYMQE